MSAVLAAGGLRSNIHDADAVFWNHSARIDCTLVFLFNLFLRHMVALGSAGVVAAVTVMAVITTCRRRSGCADRADTVTGTECLCLDVVFSGLQAVIIVDVPLSRDLFMTAVLGPTGKVRAVAMTAILTTRRPGRRFPYCDLILRILGWVVVVLMLRAGGVMTSVTALTPMTMIARRRFGHVRFDTADAVVRHYGLHVP